MEIIDKLLNVARTSSSTDWKQDNDYVIDGNGNTVAITTRGFVDAEFIAMFNPKMVETLLMMINDLERFLVVPLPKTQIEMLEKLYYNHKKEER